MDNVLPKLAAGGISCAIMSFILNPMDLTKVRLQTQNELQKLSKEKQTFRGFFHCTQKIAHEEGLLTLWTRGLTASMIREMSYSSIRMGMYDPIKGLLVAENETHPSLAKKIFAGLISGALGSFFVNPTDVTKIRIQGDVREPGKPPRYKNTFNAFFRIYKEEGIVNGLYKGAGATTLRASILTSAQMSSYDHTKHLLLRYDRHFSSDTVHTHVIAALVSGFVTAVATSPVDVIKTRYMNSPSGRYKNAFDCFIKTVRVEGPTALFKGFLPNYFRLGPHFVFALPLFEQLRILFGVGSI